MEEEGGEEAANTKTFIHGACVVHILLSLRKATHKTTQGIF